MNNTKKNIYWSLFSSILPLFAGLIFFPLIIKEYGLDRFGFLGLVWALLGYFGLFDLGLSRALTKLVAENLGKGVSHKQLSELINTGFVLTLILGLIGGLFLWLLTPWLITSFIGAKLVLAIEAEHSFLWVSLSIPFVINSTAMRGVLEGMGFFKSASLIRMILGVGTFLCPYLATFFSSSLDGAMLSLLILRVIVWGLHIVSIKNNCQVVLGSINLNKRWIDPLIKFGGWMTLSNIISPLLSYMDRFAISFFLGTAAVGYYIIPYEIITKLVVVPMAISGVLFPLFSRDLNLHSENNAQRLSLGLQYMLIITIPPSLFLAYLAPELLKLWLNQNMSVNGSQVAILLVMGVMVNCIAHLYYALVQGAGRADWTAKLHLLELVPYIFILFASLKYWGITGAAFAWFIRALIDLVGLLFFSKKINIIYFNKTLTTLLFSVVFIISLSLPLFIDSFYYRIFLLFFLFILYVIISFKIFRNTKIF